MISFMVAVTPVVTVLVALLFAERLSLEVWLAVGLLCGALLLVRLDKRGIATD